MSYVASIHCSCTKRHDYAVLRLTSAAQAGEAFGFVVNSFTLSLQITCLLVYPSPRQLKHKSTFYRFATQFVNINLYGCIA